MVRKLSFIFSSVARSKLWVQPVGWTHYGQARPKGLRNKIGGLFLGNPLPLGCDKIFGERIEEFFLSQWLQRFGQLLLLLLQRLCNYNCVLLTLLISAHYDIS